MTNGSPSIEWAKGAARIRYSLATSGVRPCSKELLDPRPEDLEISGPNSDGWPPLLEKLAQRHGLEPRRVALAHGTSMANHLARRQELEPAPVTEMPVAWISLRGGLVDDLVGRPETGFDATVVPGRFFGDATRFRLGFGMASETLEGGLRRLGTALDEVARDESPHHAKGAFSLDLNP